MLKNEYDYCTVLKLHSWARSLPDDVDFVDYWYSLYLSDTKRKIDDIIHNINAFHWTRWKEDFEEFVDKYIPQNGEGFGADEREWFALAMQCVVYSFQLTSKQIAEFYGKDVFLATINDWFKYHTFGVDHFIDRFVERFGLPPGTEIIKIGM